MKIYLDNSFLNRPFDELSTGLNRLEADALFFILECIQKDRLDLVHSAVIEYENSLNPVPERKSFVDEIMKTAVVYRNLDDTIRRRAMHIRKTLHVGSIDALHLACAEAASVDFFLTCDYTLIKRYKGDIRAISPLEFMHHYEECHSV